MATCDAITVLRADTGNATSALVELYRAATDNLPHDAMDTKRSARLLGTVSLLLGGTWDLYQMGVAYSYSMHCVRHVELSVHRSTVRRGVLLCQESVDTAANDCGAPEARLSYSAHLKLVSAGTAFDRIVPSRGAVEPSLEFYRDFELGDRHREEHAAAALKVVTEVSPIDHGAAASELRGRIEAMWPDDKWNVLIERHEGHKNFWSVEQLHYQWPSLELAISIFNRQCWAPTNPKRVRRKGKRHGAAHDEL